VRFRDGLAELFGLCVLAGVLVAAMLYPPVGAFGVLSNSAGATMNRLSSRLLRQAAPLVTTITDRAGTPIAYVFDQNRTLAAPDQIADTMKAAIVAIEDRRFYDHHGVDWPGTFRAAVSDRVAGDITQGGSTLTQQYVKNYLVHVLAADDPVKQAKAIEQTPARKLREIRLALQLEKDLSKDQILARYLNVVPFGNQAYGVSSAARTFFNTTPDKLTIAQAALLAGLVNSPSSLNPETNPREALDRRNVVIQAMSAQHRITPQAAEEARNSPLGLVHPLNTLPDGCVGAGPANGFFCQYVVDYLEHLGFTDDQLKRGGYTIRTTLDQNATAAAKAAAEAQVPKDADGIANVMTVIEPGRSKHPVRALVANRDFGLDTSRGQTVYPLPSGVAKFGAGSIYKVFTAAAALEAGMGIDNVIPVPATYTSRVYHNGTEPYVVGNAEGVSPGPRTLRQALATSPNTAFVALEERVGLTNVVDMAVRLGMRQTLTQSDPNGDPVAGPVQSQAETVKRKNIGAFTLGYSPASPLELGNVAATLVSTGVWCPPSPIENITDANGAPMALHEQPCEQVVDPQLANAMVVGLSRDSQPGGTAYSAARHLAWSRPTLSKTGTTENSESAAFLAATPQFAGSVMTFTDGVGPQGICDSDPPQLCGANGNLYGGTVPARTWFEAMSQIHNGLPVMPLPPVTPRYADGR
jgi:membrane peptidoglycan carboxypeptidase